MKIGNMPKRLRSDVDWEDVAFHLKEYPETPVLHDHLTGAKNVRSRYATVKKGGIIALRSLGGVVEPSVRNSVDNASGRASGDLWLTWHPDQEQEGVYAERYLEQDRKAGRR